MRSAEYRAAFSLAGIFSCRVLGMAMILPVFALYTQHLEGATPLLMGVTLGIYGLTQAIFQLPLGALSDRIGRRSVIALGLLLLLLGSVICARTHHVLGMMLGRALQGSGAIGSTIFAFLADTVRQQHRAKAMAIVGFCLGLSFSVAIVLGPVFDHYVHLQGIFLLTATLSLLALAILFTIPLSAAFSQSDTKNSLPILLLLRRVACDIGLMRLNVSILVSHALLVAVFMGFPVLLAQALSGYAEFPLWQVYLPVLIGAFLVMFPVVWWAEKQQKIKLVFLGSVGMLVVALLFCALPISHRLSFVALGLWLFFSAFSVLEAILPSLVSKMAPEASKGGVMGLYSSFQFAGIFVGGLFGGWMQHHYGVSFVFMGCALLAGFWFLLLLPMEVTQVIVDKTSGGKSNVKRY